MEETEKKQHSLLKIIGYIAVVLITFISLLIFFSVRWCLKTWQHLSVDELIYTMTAPIKGTGNGMINEYMLKALLPSIILTLLTIVFLYIAKRIRKVKPAICLVLAACVALGGYKGVYKFYKTLEIGDYIYNQLHPSSFIEDNYADPHKTEVSFTKKRNLIYIFLESMEMTYTDAKSGGAFKQNIIPELTKVAQENEDFSGNESKLNGGVSLTGATWTMGAMFGQTTGLPLRPTAGTAGLDTQESFFPSIRGLGDILKDQGYNQTLLIGSDATFGGRRAYFTSHGNYNIEDYAYAKQQGWIPQDYNVFWGYEDHKLFNFARNEITNLSKKNQPFNMTMLTVDTHFEDGYKCKYCDNQFGNQYADCMHCSSRHVVKFVEWAKKQPWYKDTTIVISGDHPTMASHFCDSVPSTYQRKVYSVYINAAVKPKQNTYRLYSTFDHFPTTLAAMGATIKGDRLALGTNLFSDKKTLLEQYGVNYVQKELKRRSPLLQKLEKSEVSAQTQKRSTNTPYASFSVTHDDQKLYAYVSTIENIALNDIDHLEMQISSDAKGSHQSSVKMTHKEKRRYDASIDYTSLKGKTKTVYVKVYVVSKNNKKYDSGTQKINI